MGDAFAGTRGASSPLSFTSPGSAAPFPVLAAREGGSPSSHTTDAARRGWEQAPLRHTTVAPRVKHPLSPVLGPFWFVLVLALLNETVRQMPKLQRNNNSHRV